MAANTKFQKLLEPGYIGSVRTKNRILRMGANPGFPPYEEGYVQQYYFNFYEALAKGGAGLVTIGIKPVGAPKGKGFDLDDDKYLPRMREMTDAVHKYDCPVFIQMFHIGPWLPPPLTVAASSFIKEEIPTMMQDFPGARELTVAEIKDIVKEFGDTVERAKRAGFDGIEINAGCTHLFNTFLSRAWNKRTDEYGFATMENRARIVVEIVQEIKKRNSKDFAVVVLFNVAEPGLENGLNKKEALEFSRIFEAAGADAIHARIEFYIRRKATGLRESTHFPDVALYPEIPPYAESSGVDISHHGKGGWVPIAKEIKKVVHIPVISVGRLDPEMGEKLIRSGAVDFVNLNRRLMADHDLPHKLMENRIEDIAPCTACMTCFSTMEQELPAQCRINAALGKEKEYEIKPADKKKKVAVIGSGPAGMEAARVAALRGHSVTLFEKEPGMGGSMNLAAVVKGTEREELPLITKYFKTQLTKEGVDIKLKTEANRTVIQELKPDVVIVASGGKHNIPDIPGINNKKVLTSKSLHSQLKKYLRFFGTGLMEKLVKIYMPVGKNVVIMGGGIHGCQTAEFLRKHGRNVTIVETGPEIGEGLLPHLIKPQLIDWLNKHDVAMLPGVKYEEITDEGLVISRDGKKQTIPADTIITSLPMKPDMELCDSFKDTAPEVYCIGDTSNPALIVDAVADGSRIARAI